MIESLSRESIKPKFESTEQKVRYFIKNRINQRQTKFEIQKPTSKHTNSAKSGISSGSQFKIIRCFLSVLLPYTSLPLPFQAQVMLAVSSSQQVGR